MAPLIALAVIAFWGSASLAAPLSPQDAAGHIGETATVCGMVASAEYEADAQGQPTYWISGNQPRTRSLPP
ncbi:MAG: hypothetical protein JO229_04760 [Alphaproteobacteria bacterium]|nr:hypothetical protein [Alphaproteobacteria bacterium]